MWRRFEEAAAKAGCSVDQIQPYFEMALNTCRPMGMRPNPVGGKAAGPVQEIEVFQAEYRIALYELLKCLDGKQFEETFALLFCFRRLTSQCPFLAFYSPRAYCIGRHPSQDAANFPMS
jgi:hypothetical protein